MVFRIALRSVLRQRRRTALTALAIVASFALLIVMTGFADGTHEQMADIGIRMGLGDVVVEPVGYRDDPTIDRTLSDASRVEEAARALGIPLDGVARRLRTDGLVQAGGAGLGAVVWGVDPAVEGQLSKIGAPDSIVQGAALDADDTSPPAGQPPPVVIGRDMATELGAHVGDRVTVTVQPAKRQNGETQSMRTGAFLVKGIYSTGVLDVDAHVVLVPIASLQRLTDVEGGVTMVAILLRETRRTPEATAALAARLSGSADDVLPWQKAAPELYSAIVIDEGGMYVMMAILYIVVAAGILNTILLSVLERTRELGVLLALGTPPSRVVAIVMTESLILGVASIAVGLVIGLLGNHRLETHGIALDVGHMEASGVLLPSHFYSDLAPEKVVWSALVVLAIVLLSAVYPALRASRLNPVEAMHHA